MEDTGDIKVQMSRLTIGGFLLRFSSENNQGKLNILLAHNFGLLLFLNCVVS